MKILLTGATGYIGSNLLPKLIQAKHEVFCLLRDSSNATTIQHFPVKIIKYKEKKQLYSIINEIKPELAIHLAGEFLTQHSKETIEELIESNISFPTVLLDALNENGCKHFINTGSYWQYYERTGFHPSNLYASTKQAFETSLKYYVECEEWICLTLQLYDVYGPNDTRRKILNILHDMKDQEDIDMSKGEQKLFLCYIDDAIEAYMIAIDTITKLEKKQMEKYSVRGNHAYTLKEIVTKYLEISNKQLNINWGGREYRLKEIMIPEQTIEVLPNWRPNYDLAEGLKAFELGWK